jgi:hypothetical protein
MAHSMMQRFNSLSEVQLSIFTTARNKKDHATSEDITRLSKDHIKAVKELLIKKEIDIDNKEYEKVEKNKLSLYEFLKNLLSNEINKRKFDINYEDFVNETFPIFKIVYSKPKTPTKKGTYFNVMRLTSNTYKKRFICLLTNLDTLWNLQNKEERENKQNKDIMINLAFNINQSNEKGLMSINAIKYIESTFKICFDIFYSDLMKDYITTLKLAPKKSPPIFSIPDELLLKTYTIPKKEDDEKESEEINYYAAKFMGNYVDNYLQSLIIDAETNKPVVYDKDEDVNFHNIKNAIPKGSTVSIYLDFTSAYLSLLNNKIYLSNKMFQIYVKRNMNDINNTTKNNEYLDDIRKEMGLAPIVNLEDDESKTVKEFYEQEEEEEI